MVNTQNEKEYKISWLKVLGVIALIIIIIVIICLVYPKKDTKTDVNSVYITNINLMKEAGKEFFQGNNLPNSIGDKTRISLEDMINNNLIVEFLDENGHVCNATDSYVETTKITASEYDMKTFLSCDNKSDYIVNTIYKEDNDCCKVETQVKTETKETKNETKTSNTPKVSTTNQSKTSTTPTVNKTYNITYLNNCNGSCVNNIYYTVSFDSQGGSSISTQTVKKDATATYVAPTRSGYRFLGWYLNNNLYDFNTPVTQTLTLIAKWEKITTTTNKYTVSFDTDGGGTISSQSIVEAGYVKKPNDPSKECYIFSGWYTADGKRFDFNTPIYQNMTLYARYTEDSSCYVNTYRVTFVYNNGNSNTTTSVNEGSKISKPKTPTRSGYTFDNWYYYDANGNYVVYNFNNRIYKNITLYAEWDKDIDLYYEYCKVNTKTYYSVAYISANSTLPMTMNWSAKLEDINASDVTITSASYLNSTASYNAAATYKGLSMVGATANSKKYEVPVTSGSQLKTYSLKSNNFTESVSKAYYSNGNWYVDLSANIKNTNNATSYYASNINSYIYFVPYTFTISYTDLNDCTIDLADNQNRYSNYKVINSYNW